MRDAKSNKHDMTDGDEEATGGAEQDVFEMLKADHRRVEELFSQFEDADKRARSQIAEDTLRELAIHTTLEEELVYPAIREALEEEALVDQAEEEHHVAKLLMKELGKMKPADEKFSAKFKVLGEIIRHHVEEEENEIFPQAEEAEFETAELSQEVQARKSKLIRKMEGGGKKSSQRRKAA
jgi:hemerythrin superfamily protein